ESYQANVGFERELPKRWVAEANYTYNRGIHLWREFNVNAPRLPAGFSSFTQYLSTRDFPNFLSGPGGSRPIINTTTAGDLVRFVLNPPDPANPNSRSTQYLSTRDFPNFLSGPGGSRPIINTTTAGDLVRFVLNPPDPANPNSTVRIFELGVP